VTAPGGSLDVLALAERDQDSVLELAGELVRIPSRGGIDRYEPVLDHVGGWLGSRGLDSRVLRDQHGSVVGLTCEVRGGLAGPRWVLDACLDTAPFGDETTWTHPPTSGVVEDGWLWGRGSADSKTGAAIFCHIAVHLAAIAARLAGSLVLLFDVDEHTGGFGGAKRYFAGPDAPEDVAGVMIGYPGMDKLVVGGRGVHRARLHVHGVASHSGGRRPTSNAITKAADLVRLIESVERPAGVADFPLPGKLTVTAISGGQGYSQTPDLCTVALDVRTTPSFDSPAVRELLEKLTARLDSSWPNTRPTLIEADTVWPPYALSRDAPLRAAVLDAAHASGIAVEPKIAGPSNIGNYLAGLGIPATAGFGVDYTGLHATDERARIDTIPVVQAVYHQAMISLLG
jgi:succinyl-diaminopimelate desuccinylase